ncbi:MAG: hypothetical protein M1819_001925 [Sarea resinae]|nr:MAG: hypothetical protein M1819_001925 [Sarea resinae]
MKAGAFALAASALLGTVVAGSSHNRRHAHEAFHLRNALEAREPTCTCVSTVTVYVPEATSTQLSTVVVSPTAASNTSTPSLPTSSAPATVPTPSTTTFTSTGVYTIPASTITLTSTATVPVATSTVCSPGVQTIGGVTTVVPSATTVTLPYATVETTGSATTSTIYTTTYVCPTSGTYTIAPVTTTLNQTSTVTYPVPTTYTPGTYTQSATTVTITTTSDVFVCPFATPSPNTTYSSSIPTSTPAPVNITTPVSSAASSYIPSPSVNSTSSAIPTSSYVPSSSSASPSSSSAWSTSSSWSSSASPSSSPASSSWSSSASSSWSSSASPSSSAASWSSSASSSSTPTSSGSASGTSGWGISASGSWSASASGSISANGNLWAMAYSPYTSSGGCKDSGAVASDIAAIAGKGFKAVRIYSTDCSGLENVGNAAKANGMKIILGIFISSSGISGAESQVTDILNWAQWDLVEMIVIGNEAIFNGYCSGSDLANFISSCKSKFSGAGYTGPCTTTEPLNTLQENTGSLCGVIDVVASNLHPFFNSGIAADMAGAFVAAQLKLVEVACPGKDAYNLETGWPSSGSGSNGQAIPGTSEQSTAIQQITQAAGSKSVMFSWENDEWKQPGEFGVERNWGCGNVFGGN